MTPFERTWIQEVHEHEGENENQSAINEEVGGIRTPSLRSKSLPLKQTQYLLANDHPVCCEAQGTANAISHLPVVLQK